LEVSVELIKELREQCGAGVMECRNALIEVGGDVDKALGILKERGIRKAEKKAGRTTAQGLVEAYVHSGGRVGALIEINCETDFVARTDEFRELAHELAMQVTALAPQYIDAEEIPKGADADPQSACLLQQAYIRDPSKTVQELITEVIAKVGENIKVSRFARFELGVRD
jgi:elongation factor Ts